MPNAMDGTGAVRRIRWALVFGAVAALAAAFGAAIFAVWGDSGEQNGAAAAEQTLLDARVLVWVGFASAAGFVLAGRDRLTSEVDRLFEEDRRVWSRRILREHEAGVEPGGDIDPATITRSETRTDGLPPLYPDPHDLSGHGGHGDHPDAPPRLASPVAPMRPPPPPRLARHGPSGRIGAAGGVILGAAIGAGLGALAGEITPGIVLGVVAGLLVGLLLDRGD